MTLLNKILPKKISHQILFIVLTLGVIPMVVLGISLVNSSYATIKQIIFRDLNQISIHAAGKVRKEFEEAWHTLDAAAAMIGTLKTDAWRQETVLVEIALRFPTLTDLCSYDSHGVPFACSNLGIRPNKSLDDELTQCLKTQRYCFSDIKHSSENLPVLDIAVPIYSQGRYQGAIKAVYNLRGIWNSIDQIQIGPRSHAILIDYHGHVLAHSDKKEILKNEGFFNSEIIRDLYEGKSSIRIIKDINQNFWLSAYAPLGDLPWGLVLLQPQEEAFVLATLMSNHSKILIFVALILTGFVGLMITRWVSSIVNEIIMATRRVAKGDLSVSLPILRNDEINRMRFAFNHMTNRLKKAQEIERLSIVGKSAASIAHELKNSLVLVKSFIQMIPIRNHDKVFVKEATDTVVGELDGWNEMLKNIMEFSKEKMPLKCAPVNINSLIEDIALFVRLKAQEFKVDLSIEMRDKTPFVHGDEQKLKQVFVNLLTNAFEATEPGGHIRVTTFVNKHLGCDVVGIEVFNSGSEISQENLDKIFDPFFSTKDHGLGLGLAISRDIVHKHGGRLEVESFAGVGIAFRLILPVYLNEYREGKVYDIRENRSR